MRVHREGGEGWRREGPLAKWERGQRENKKRKKKRTRNKKKGEAEEEGNASSGPS